MTHLPFRAVLATAALALSGCSLMSSEEPA
jgi:hypothetical protein